MDLIRDGSRADGIVATDGIGSGAAIGAGDGMFKGGRVSAVGRKIVHIATVIVAVGTGATFNVVDIAFVIVVGAGEFVMSVDDAGRASRKSGLVSFGGISKAETT